MANAKFCTHCGSPRAATAHFCATCGGRLDGAVGVAPGAAVAEPRGATSLATMGPWLVLAAGLLLALGYLLGSRVAPDARPSALAGGPDADAGIVVAPDISTMSPEERVDRLFNRVMALSAAGKEDSVQFFAPMAINALAALMPLDLHRRYDLGLIQLAAGDAGAARAQADTILQQQATHLLGLSLAMRAALAENRTADARRLGTTLTSVAAAERAKRLPEYAEHAPDIAEALDEAAGRGPARPR